eukprot:CFRG0686T1
MAQRLKERRLNPIYDACDQGNYRLAVQLTDKVLKKDPSLDTAVALRALAQNRMGNREEALAGVKSLSIKDTFDESCLQVVSIAAKEAGKPELIVPMYEQVVKKHPHNEDLSNTLFMWFVRMKRFKDMQTLSMNCYKNFKHDKYYFWGVMCNLLQAKEQIRQGNSTMAKKVYLPLAERMMSKALEDNRIVNEEQLSLYFQILQAQEKYSQAASIAESPVGVNCLKDQVERVQVTSDLHEQARHTARVVELRRSLLDLNVDEWGSWRRYIAAVVALEYERLEGCTKSDNSTTEKTTSNVDTTPPVSPKNKHEGLHFDANDLFINFQAKSRDPSCSDRSPVATPIRSKLSSQSQKVTLSDNDSPIYRALEYIEKKIKDEGQKPEHRGPFLAKMELLAKLSDNLVGMDIQTCHQAIREELIKYFFLFGDKWCCLADMSPYLKFIQNDEDEESGINKSATEFISSLMEDGLSPPVRNISEWKTLTRYTCCLQLARRLGVRVQMKQEQRVQLVNQMVQMYINTIDLGKNLLPTERQYNDDIILLTIQNLVDLYEGLGTSEKVDSDMDKAVYLEVAAVLITFAQNASPTNFYLKANLVSILRYLGAVAPAYKVYKSMDVKYIQHDTLSYFIRPSLITMAHYEDAKQANKTVGQIYKHNLVEVPEMVVKAFKHSTFSKIEEFIRFQERLDSIQKQQLASDNVWISLLLKWRWSVSCLETLETVSSLETSDHVLDKLSDNRDFTVLKSQTNNPVTSTTTLVEAHETVAKAQMKLDVRMSGLQLKFARALLVAKTTAEVDPIKEELSKCLEDIRISLEHKGTPERNGYVRTPVIGPSVSPVYVCVPAVECLLALAHPSLCLGTIQASASDDEDLKMALEALCKAYQIILDDSGLTSTLLITSQEAHADANTPEKSKIVVADELFFMKLTHLVNTTMILTLYTEQLVTPFNNRKTKKGVFPALPDWAKNQLQPTLEKLSSLLNQAIAVLDECVIAPEKESTARLDKLPESVRAMSEVTEIYTSLQKDISDSRLKTLYTYKEVLSTRAKALCLKV